MGVVKNLLVRAGMDASGITKGAKEVNKKLNAMKSQISSTMSKIKSALAIVGVGKLIKDSTQLAMTNEASIQQINRAMNVHSKEFLAWANTQALAYNMAKADATKYGAVYSNLISGFEGDTKKVTQYTIDLLKSSAIVASGTGRKMEDVMERIRSGMLGNTESIEDLGINVNIAMIESTDAFKKFANGKSWQQLNFQTQQQIRLFAILEQVSKKYGDSINENAVSSQQQFIAQLKNIQLYLGQAFLPIYQIVLPALTNLASKIANVMSVIAQFSQALFGKNKQAENTNKQTDAVNALGSAYQKTGQKAKNALAGFDEINSLSKASGGGADETAGAGTESGAAGSMPVDFNTNAPDVSAKVQAMADKVKTIMGDLSSFMKTHKDIIVGAIAGIAAGFTAFQIMTNWTAIITGLKVAFTAVAAAIGGISLPILLISAAIAALVGGFIYFYKTNEGFKGVVDGILNAIKDAAVYLWQNVLVPLGQFLADVFVKAWDVVSKAAEWLWKNVLVPIGDFLLWIWKNVILPVAEVIEDVLGTAFKIVADIAESFWKNVLVPLGNFFKDLFGPTVEALSAIFTFLWEKVLVPFGNFIDKIMKPIWSGLVKVIQYLWEEVLKPLVEFVGGRLKTVFDTVFKGIGETINGLKKTLTGIMNFITGVFTGDWGKAWEGIKKIFQGVFDSLYSIVKTPLNLIIDLINSLIKGLNKINIKMPDWAGGKSFGINIPEIPKLENGGITNGRTILMAGDNPGGREVISPLDDLNDIVTASVNAAMSNQKSSGPTTVIMKFRETELARAVITAINDYQRSGGTTVLEV